MPLVIPHDSQLTVTYIGVSVAGVEGHIINCGKEKNDLKVILVSAEIPSTRRYLINEYRFASIAMPRREKYYTLIIRHESARSSIHFVRKGAKSIAWNHTNNNK